MVVGTNRKGLRKHELGQYGLPLTRVLPSCSIARSLTPSGLARNTTTDTEEMGYRED